MWVWLLILVVRYYDFLNGHPENSISSRRIISLKGVGSGVTLFSDRVRFNEFVFLEHIDWGSG